MRLAVFVDGENLCTHHAPAISAIVNSFARPILSRVYGDAVKIARWGEQPGFSLIHCGTGKNATDLLLCIDAMDYALSGGCDTLIIASSDRDFTHIAQRLREKGFRVIGVGEDKASARFRLACSEFHTLAQIPAAKPAATVPLPVTPMPQPHTPPNLKVVVPPETPAWTVLDDKIRAEITQASQGGSGITLAALNIAMRARYQFVISEMPEKNWRKYLANRPALYMLEAKGPNAKVRFLPKGFRAMPQQLKASQA